jgi:hypothetical protein
MLKFLKRLFSDNVQIGQVWELYDPNPFMITNKYKIIDRINDWVKIELINNRPEGVVKTTSISIRELIDTYELYSDVNKLD